MRFGTNDTDGSTYGNFLNGDSVVSSAAAVASGFALSSASTEFLGDVVQLAPMFTVYSSSTAARQNDQLTINYNAAGDVTETVTDGVYNEASAESELTDKVNNINASLSMTFSPSTGKWKVIGAASFTVRASLTNEIWESLGFGTGDLNSSAEGGNQVVEAPNICPINADKSTAGAPIGQFFRFDMGASVTADTFAMYQPRFRTLNTGSQVPTSYPEKMDFEVYGSATDLGVKVGAWLDSGTKVCDLRWTSQNRTAIGPRYDLAWYGDNTVGAFRYYGVLFRDGSTGGADYGFHHFRFGYLFIGASEQISATLKPEQVSQWNYNQPGAMDVVYRSLAPITRNAVYSYPAMTETEAETLARLLYRIRATPALCIPDESLVENYDGQTMDHKYVLYASPFQANTIRYDVRNYATGTRAQTDVELAFQEQIAE